MQYLKKQKEEKIYLCNFVSFQQSAMFSVLLVTSIISQMSLLSILISYNQHWITNKKKLIFFTFPSLYPRPRLSWNPPQNTSFLFITTLNHLWVSESCSVAQNTTLFSSRERSASNTSLWLARLSLGPEQMREGSSLWKETDELKYIAARLFGAEVHAFLYPWVTVSISP